MRLPVGVAYGNNVEKLQRVWLEMADDNSNVLKEPPPTVRFLEFGDSALNFEPAVWTVDTAHRPTRIRSDLFFAIECKLRENNIEVSFPQRDLHLRTGKLVLETQGGNRTETTVQPG